GGETDSSIWCEQPVDRSFATRPGGQADVSEKKIFHGGDPVYLVLDDRLWREPLPGAGERPEEGTLGKEGGGRGRGAAPGLDPPRRPGRAGQSHRRGGQKLAGRSAPRQRGQGRLSGARPEGR